MRRALGMKKGFAVKQTLKTQVVGMARFERAVSASRTQRSTTARLSHIREEALLSPNQNERQAFFWHLWKKGKGVF